MAVTTVRIDDDLMRKVKQYALDHDMTMTEVFENGVLLLLNSTANRPPLNLKIPISGGKPHPDVDLRSNASIFEFLEKHGG